MNTATFRCDLPCCEDLLPRVIRQAGYPSPLVVKPEMLMEIRRITQRAAEWVRPEGLYRIDPLAGCRRGVLWGECVRVRSRRWAGLAARLSEPRVLCCFVVTLGEELDRQIRREQERSMFVAYLLDAVGSVLAEWLADRMESHIAGRLREQGFEATGRFSPGYCDWEIRDGQQAIFQALRPETVGVACAPSGMMVPRKSISACMLGAPGVERRYPCSTCARTGCEYRREAGEGGQGVQVSA